MERHADAVVMESADHFFRGHENPAALKDLQQHFDGHGRRQWPEKHDRPFLLRLPTSPLFVGTRRIDAEVKPTLIVERLARKLPCTHMVEQLIAHSNV